MYSGVRHERRRSAGTIRCILSPRTLSSSGFERTTEMAKAMARSFGRLGWVDVEVAKAAASCTADMVDLGNSKYMQETEWM